MNKLKTASRLQHGFAVLLLILFSGTSRAEILYEVEWQEHTVWILGTIHLARNTDTKLSERALTALQESDQLWMEMTRDELTRSSEILFESGLKPQSYLPEVLAPEVWEQLASTTSRLGLAPSVVARMEPWLLEYVVLVLTLRNEGFDSTQGIDFQVLREAAELNKDIYGFELAEEQVEILSAARSNISVDEHINYILTESPSLLEEIVILERHWQRGELDEIMAFVDTDMTEYTQHILLVERNQRWFRMLQQVLSERPGVLFVAVGTAHLGGEQGLLQLFERSGAKVTRHKE
ncbi:MAG: hypothetical protein HLUCCO02_12070 [Idiomarinaceae bacterium HL-53]|nr:MAG: hypothetical protein HLUCCO02_12070 [Idiomarinaceae bacterium HL-53]CUS49398.1 Uncharacterized conserved protein YbaP, TraB family [Idiomarinaceae bacterium HL-53]